MKTKWNQMVIVGLLLVVITSIVIYMWYGIAEIIHFFDHAAYESLTNLKVLGL